MHCVWHSTGNEHFCFFLLYLLICWNRQNDFHIESKRTNLFVFKESGHLAHVYTFLFCTYCAVAPRELFYLFKQEEELVTSLDRGKHTGTEYEYWNKEIKQNVECLGYFMRRKLACSAPWFEKIPEFRLWTIDQTQATQYIMRIEIHSHFLMHSKGCHRHIATMVFYA